MQRTMIINQVLDHLNLVFRLTKINTAEELNAVFSKFIFQKEQTLTVKLLCGWWGYVKLDLLCKSHKNILTRTSFLM